MRASQPIPAGIGGFHNGSAGDAARGGCLFLARHVVFVLQRISGAGESRRGSRPRGTVPNDPKRNCGRHPHIVVKSALPNTTQHHWGVKFETFEFTWYNPLRGTERIA